MTMGGLLEIKEDVAPRSSFEATRAAVAEIDERKTVNIVLVGGTAKLQNELMLAYTNRRASPEFVPIVLENMNTFDRVQDQFLHINIVGTAGMDSPHDADHKRSRRALYENASVIIGVASVTSKQSYKDLKCIWVPEVRDVCPETPFMIAGTESENRAALPQDMEELTLDDIQLEEDNDEKKGLLKSLKRTHGKQQGAVLASQMNIFAEEEEEGPELDPLALYTPKGHKSEEMSRVEALMLAKSLHALMYTEVSAKEYRNIIEMFDMANRLALGMIEDKEETEQDCMGIVREISAEYPRMRQILYTASPFEQRAHVNSIKSIRAMDDFIYTAGDDGFVCVWHVESGVLLRRFEHEKAVIGFDVSGEFLAVLDSSVKVYLWSLFHARPLMVEKLGKYDAKLPRYYQVMFPMFTVTYKDKGAIHIDEAVKEHDRLYSEMTLEEQIADEVEREDEETRLIQLVEDEEEPQEQQEEYELEIIPGINDNVCRPSFFVVSVPWSDSILRFPVDGPSNRLQLIPNPDPKYRNFSRLPDKTRENLSRVCLLKTYFLINTEIVEGVDYLDDNVFVVAAYENGDIIAFDGITGDMVQYFPAKTKKLRWFPVTNEDEIVTFRTYNEQQLKEGFIRKGKKGTEFEKGLVRGRAIESFELLAAASVSITLEDHNKDDVVLARSRDGKTKGRKSVVGQKKNSMIERRFLSLVRCDGFDVTFFSFKTGHALRSLEYRQKGFACPLMSMKLMHDGHVMQIFCTTKSRDGNDLIVHYSEPWNELRRLEPRLFEGDDIIEYDGFTIFPTFHEQESKPAGAFWIPRLHSIPFPIDYMDVAYIPRSLEAEDEEMVLVGSNSTGNSFLFYIQNESVEEKVRAATLKKKKQNRDVSTSLNIFKRLESKLVAEADEELASDNIHLFSLFPEHQGLGAQLIHNYDLVASSAVRRKDGAQEDEADELNRVATYNLLHQKMKTDCRSIYWWESLFAWFMLMKDHAEMLSLSFESEFKWPQNFFGLLFRLLSLYSQGVVSPRAVITLFWVFIILMAIFNLGYIFMGYQMLTKKYSHITNLLTVYLPFMASMALFTIASMVVLMFQCSWDSSQKRLVHDYFAEEGIKYCFEGVHLLYIFAVLVVFVPFFIISLRVRSMGGISGISRDYWLSWKWDYDERSIFVGHYWLMTPSAMYEISYTSTRIFLVAVSTIFNTYITARIVIYGISAAGLFILTTIHPAYVRPAANSLNSSLFLAVLLTNIFSIIMVNTDSYSERLTYLYAYSGLILPFLLIMFLFSRCIHFNELIVSFKKEFISALSNEHAKVLNTYQWAHYFVKDRTPEKSINMGVLEREMPKDTFGQTKLRSAISGSNLEESRKAASVTVRILDEELSRVESLSPKATTSIMRKSHSISRGPVKDEATTDDCSAGLIEQMLSTKKQ